MSTQRFFDEAREQSVVKATIVEKYFDAWAGIIVGAQNKWRPTANNRIGYVDLFAGPGRYKDGAISTPLRILQKAIERPEYAARLMTIFNDKDQENVRSLQEAINALPGIEKLAHRPEVWNEEVGDKIAQDFARINTIPLLAFIDPWGYKGLTLGLVNSFIKDWGCDCIFFFNYARINMGLSNPFVHEHMCALFGDERAARLRDELEPMSSADRELTIVNELVASLKNFGQRLVLPFRFRSDTGARTTHHLIFVTKSFKGYAVMKGIMAGASTNQAQGVPSFEFNPADKRYPMLFEFSRPLDDLQEMLLADYTGQRQLVSAIYAQHSVGKPYVSRNYKDVLMQMEAAGVVSVDPPANKRRKGTLSDKAMILFPARRA